MHRMRAVWCCRCWSSKNVRVARMSFRAQRGIFRFSSRHTLHASLLTLPVSQLFVLCQSGYCHADNLETPVSPKYIWFILSILPYPLLYFFSLTDKIIYNETGILCHWHAHVYYFWPGERTNNRNSFHDEGIYY